MIALSCGIHCHDPDIKYGLRSSFLKSNGRFIDIPAGTVIECPSFAIVPQGIKE